MCVHACWLCTIWPLLLAAQVAALQAGALGELVVITTVRLCCQAEAVLFVVHTTVGSLWIIIMIAAANDSWHWVANRLCGIAG